MSPMPGDDDATIHLEFNWPQFAWLCVYKIAEMHMSARAKAGERTDEFVVRQALRECFTHLCPGLTLKKEDSYSNSSQRLDLSMGENHPLNIAVELKSDPFDAQGVEDDWKKILKADQKYKLVIFAGVTQEQQLANLKNRFSSRNATIASKSPIKTITSQFTPFGSDENIRPVSFIWIWSLGAPLPKGVELRLIADDIHHI